MMQKTRISSLSCVNLRLLSYPRQQQQRVTDLQTLTLVHHRVQCCVSCPQASAGDPLCIPVFHAQTKSNNDKEIRVLWSSVEDDSHFYVNAGADDGLHCEQDCFLSASGKQRDDDGCSFPRSASSTLPEPCGKWRPNITYRRQAGVLHLR